MKALTEDFLYELYGTAMDNDMVAALVAVHMDRSYLPNRHFQKIQSAFQQHWHLHKEAPSYGVLSQLLSNESRCLDMLEDFKACGSDNIDATLDALEEYIRGVKLKQTIESIAKDYNSGNLDKAEITTNEYASWSKEFSLKPTDMVDIIGTFESRYRQNQLAAEESNGKKKPVERFYVDEMDRLNSGRNLRGQLTLALASSGVGKSHYARHIGECACVEDGLDVLHIQLEGTKKEVTDAYSASLAGYNSSYYEQADIPEDEFMEILEELKSVSGKLMVKSFYKFGSNVSTMDIKRIVDEYIDSVGKAPDVVIVDSLDLLTDSNKNKSKKELRHVRLSVAQDLKNLAMEYDCWVFATYQATIENPEFLNNEQNKLTRYHLSEAKGIIRPLTHLISLNQTESEKAENTMRIFIDKSRFFKGKQGTIKIKTDYDRGRFYDPESTMRFITHN